MLENPTNEELRAMLALANAGGDMDLFMAWLDRSLDRTDQLSRGVVDQNLLRWQQGHGQVLEGILDHLRNAQKKIEDRKKEVAGKPPGTP
jgi:hypothetical protein